MKHYQDEKRLSVNIRSYNLGMTEFPTHQKQLAPLLDDIEQISFTHIDTKVLLATTGKPKGINEPIKQYPAHSDHTEEDNQVIFEPVAREDTEKEISQTLTVSIKNVGFRDGCAVIQSRIRGHPEMLDIEIPNVELKKEYDSVRNYFAKVLKTKKITVYVSLKTLNGKVTDISASSPHIQKINQEFIKQLRLECIKDAIKKSKQDDAEKNLFTTDEYFGTFNKEFNIKSFDSSDDDLLNDIILASDTKHYNHLQYLSRNHEHQIMKLRIVVKPSSFLFLLKGKNNFHIVWETIDTEEATYVWKVSGNLNEIKSDYRKVESAINDIKAFGKTAYIKKPDESFTRIFHDYSDVVDGFIKWKSKLKSIID